VKTSRSWEKFGGKAFFRFFLMLQKETARPAQGRQREKKNGCRKIL